MIKATFYPTGNQPVVIHAADVRTLFELLETISAENDRLRAQRDMLVTLIERSNDDPNERNPK